MAKLGLWEAQTMLSETLGYRLFAISSTRLPGDIEWQTLQTQEAIHIYRSTPLSLLKPIDYPFDFFLHHGITVFVGKRTQVCLNSFHVICMLKFMQFKSKITSNIFRCS